MNDVDPQLYPRDVLSKIVANHPMSRVDELLPFAYVPAVDGVAPLTSERTHHDESSNG
jgi:hypothetical protein